MHQLYHDYFIFFFFALDYPETLRKIPGEARGLKLKAPTQAILLTELNTFAGLISFTEFLDLL